MRTGSTRVILKDNNEMPSYINPSEIAEVKTIKDGVKIIMRTGNMYMLPIEIKGSWVVYNLVNYLSHYDVNKIITLDDFSLDKDSIREKLVSEIKEGVRNLLRCFAYPDEKTDPYELDELKTFYGMSIKLVPENNKFHSALLSLFDKIGKVEIEFLIESLEYGIPEVIVDFLLKDEYDETMTGDSWTIKTGNSEIKIKRGYKI